MKTFNDLKFEPWFGGIKHAVLNFDNDYGVSVLFGKGCYSNGIDTYELAVLRYGFTCYDTEITDDILGYITKEEVTDVMLKLQSYD